MPLPFLSSGLKFMSDELPDSFSFTNQTGKNANTQYESDIKQITGIDTTITATTSGGSSQLQTSTNSDGTGVVTAWASSVPVTNGLYLRARLTTGGWGGTTSAIINVGPLFTTQWDVTTTSVSGSTNNYGIGTHNITIPAYNFLTMKIWAPGGGGGGVYNNVAINTYFGGAGVQSKFTPPGGTDMIANGGVGGGNGNATANQDGTNGANGTASGGDFNTTGGGNNGGIGGHYEAGGAVNVDGGTGGKGGYVQKTWEFGVTPNAPVVGNQYTLIVGAKGAGGSGDLASGSAGTDGNAQMTWS